MHLSLDIPMYVAVMGSKINKGIENNVWVSARNIQNLGILS